jgi:hypothetical protein
MAAFRKAAREQQHCVIRAGTRVVRVVQGLVSTKPEYNGKHGNVRFFTERTGRYTVALDDG